MANNKDKKRNQPKGYKYSIVITNKRGTTYTQKRYTKSFEKYNEIMKKQIDKPTVVQTARGTRYVGGGRMFKTEGAAKKALKMSRVNVYAKETLKEYKKYWSKEDVKQLNQMKKEYNEFLKSVSKKDREHLPKFNQLIGNAKDQSLAKIKEKVMIEYRIGKGQQMKYERIMDDLTNVSNRIMLDERQALARRLDKVWDKLTPEEISIIEEASKKTYEVKNDDDDAEESTYIAVKTIEDIISKYE